MLQTSISLSLLVTALLALWGMPVLRDTVFRSVKRLPQWAQPIPPLVLAGLAAIGQGYLDGLRGDALLEQGASQAGQVGILAIGAWHTWKRWYPLAVKLWRSFRKTPSTTLLPLLCGLTLGLTLACSSTPKRVATPTVLEAATAAVNATDRALEVYIETAPETVSSDDIAPLVGKLKAAAAVVRAKGDLCDAVALLEPLVEQLNCAHCVTLAATVKGAMECP